MKTSCFTDSQIIAVRSAGHDPVRHHRAGAGKGHPLAMDVQPRAPQHGARWHHANAEVGIGCIAPLLANVKNGGITLCSIPTLTSLP